VRNILLILIAYSIGLTSCGYRQHIMFKYDKGFTPSPILQEALKAERNYVIQKNDYLALDVYSNNGERLLDPNLELAKENFSQNSKDKAITVLVDVNGITKLPMVGEVKLDGLTLRQAEEITQKEYMKFFIEPYVTFSYVNKRVIILGATGGQLIPLVNENVKIAEVLALANGVPNDSKVNNIRLLRNEEVFFIDFSTIDGYRTGNMLVEHGDIIYLEPIRRPFSESLKDYAGLISLIISVTSLIAVFSTL